MAVERFTVSLEPELAAAIRAAADAENQNVSAWMAEAARRLLAGRGLRDVVDRWEIDHGSFTTDELTAARAALSQ